MNMGAAVQVNYCLGSGGLTVANQVRDRFRAAGKALAEDDIAILDAADFHYYQVSRRASYVFTHMLTRPLLPARMVSIFVRHARDESNYMRSFLTGHWLALV